MKKRIIVFMVLALLLASQPAVMVSACPSGCDGVGTPGYWKNHPDAWPVDEITIGGVTYDQADAIELMGTREKGDKTFTLFRALVAAKLNVENGCMCGNLGGVIVYADGWMATNGPVGSGVRGSSDAWQGDISDDWQSGGEKAYLKLDAYNNGELCVPARD